MECRTWSAVGVGRQNLYLYPLPCKCWHCESCVVDRLGKLQAQLVSGQPNRFLTLTTRFLEGESPSKWAVIMRKAWTKMVKRIRHNLDKDMEYGYIWEATKKGWPHMHILIRSKFLPIKTLKRWWKELTGSYIVDIRKVKDEDKIAVYITKYITKAPHKFEGVNRYSFSRGYMLKDDINPYYSDMPKESVDWFLLKLAVDEIAHALEDAGVAEVYDDSENTLVLASKIDFRQPTREETHELLRAILRWQRRPEQGQWQDTLAAAAR